MSHNANGGKPTIELNGYDAKEVELLIKRATGQKKHLSFFERQQAHDLGLTKAMDEHGNIDLNEAANQIMRRGNTGRIPPNARASFSNNEPAPQSTTPSDGVDSALDKQRSNRNAFSGTQPRALAEAEKVAKRTQAVSDKAQCSLHCRAGNVNKSGRTTCRWCHGEGFIAKTARLDLPSSPHRERNIVK